MTKTSKPTTHRVAKKAHVAKRLSEATKNLKKIQAEIAPFITQRKIEKISTSGEWCETSAYIADVCKPYGELDAVES